MVTACHVHLALSAMTVRSTNAQLANTLLRKTWVACPVHQAIAVQQELERQLSALVANTHLVDQAAARVALQTITRNPHPPTVHPYHLV